MTHLPVRVTYGRGWDTRARAVIDPLTATEAEACDRESGEYVVVFGDGRPVVVLHVAYAAHHVGVWQYDAEGRRVREFDLRMLEPESLFRLFARRWEYVGPEQEEFDPEAARHTVELTPGGRCTEIVEPKGDRGGSRHSGVRAPLDEGRMPAYRFGIWQPLLEALGLFVEIVPGDADVAVSAGGDTERLTAPAPEYPHLLDVVFTPGVRLVEFEDRGMTVLEPQVREELLALPSGRLKVADPDLLDAEDQALTVSVAPGAYAVEEARALTDPREFQGHPLKGREETLAVRLVVADRPTVRWEMGLWPDNDLRTLRDGEAFRFGVDTATGCFADADAATGQAEEYQRVLRSGDESLYGGSFDEMSLADRGLAWFYLPGDGGYAVWIGRDADGDVTCFAVLVPDDSMRLEST